MKPNQFASLFVCGSTNECFVGSQIAKPSTEFSDGCSTGRINSARVNRLPNFVGARLMVFRGQHMKSNV